MIAGVGGGSLTACKSCIRVSYDPSSHAYKDRIEPRDEALGKDPPAKEDCQICFLPIPVDCCHDSTEVGGSVAVW